MVNNLLIPASIPQQQPSPTLMVVQSRAVKALTSLWSFVLYPFVLALYESLALWRVFTHIRRSPTLRKWIRNCLVLNGIVFLGSLLFYSFIVGPIIHWVLTFQNSHLCYHWWGGQFLPELILTPDLPNTTSDVSLVEMCEESTAFEHIENLFAVIYHLCWTIPIYLISLVANGIWHNKISEEVFRLQSTLLFEQEEMMNSSILPVPEQHHHPPDTLNQIKIAQHLRFQDQQQQQHQHQPPPSPPYQQQQEQRQQPLVQNASLESSLSPMRIFSLVTEQISRIVIFLLLLIQATILSLITLPPIFSHTLATKYPPLSIINSLIQYTPLVLSYVLTSISYTYAMFEFIWSSGQLTQLHKSVLFDSTQIAIINQLQALRGEHDMSQLNCRFRYVEFRVAYFFGFSILLTIVTFPLPFLTSISLFGLVFPLNLLTALVSKGHIDLLDTPLFPPHRNVNQQQHTNNNMMASPSLLNKRVVIPQNTSSNEALSIIYSAHNLSVPYQLPIFDLARWLNDHIFVLITRWLQHLKGSRFRG